MIGKIPLKTKTVSWQRGLSTRGKIDKEEFYELRDQSFMNEFMIENLAFNNHWNLLWYNLNTTEDDLKKQELTICGGYKKSYLLEVEFQTDSS